MKRSSNRARLRSVAVIATLALALQALAPWVTAAHAAGVGLVPICTTDGLLLVDPRDGSTRPAQGSGPDGGHACGMLCPGPCAASPGQPVDAVGDVGLGALRWSEAPPPRAVPPPSGDQGLGVRTVRGPPARA